MRQHKLFSWLFLTLLLCLVVLNANAAAYVPSPGDRPMSPMLASSGMSDLMDQFLAMGDAVKNFTIDGVIFWFALWMFIMMMLGTLFKWLS